MLEYTIYMLFTKGSLHITLLLKFKGEYKVINQFNGDLP